MKLTPLDIHHKEFRRAIRGYNEEEVDVFLDQVADEFERVFKENIELKEQVEGTKEKVKQYEGVEHTLQKALLTAQQAADDVQNNAQKESELIVRDAELKAKEIIQQVLTEKQNLQNELSDLKSAEKEFRDKFKHLLTQYLDVIGKVESGESPPAIEVPVMPEIPDIPEPVAPEISERVAPEPLLAPEQKDREAEPEPDPKPPQEPEVKDNVAAQPVADSGVSEISVSFGAFSPPRVDPAETSVEVLTAVAEAPSETIDPEVPVFDVFSGSAPQEPVEAATLPVSSFFDDDLGVDEEEKKDDWSAFPGPAADDGQPKAPNDGSSEPA
ncbi:MAG: DivIVA domain-containing protein [Actinomycetota bacterium]|nr:DivIVA domain-containing protein [Actinomycetota bacterium]